MEEEDDHLVSLFFPKAIEPVRFLNIPLHDIGFIACVIETTCFGPDPHHSPVSQSAPVLVQRADLECLTNQKSVLP